MNWPWSELGLPGPADLAEVHRAYAKQLKMTHPEENPEGFQRLYKAYQQARRLARRSGMHPVVSIRQTTPLQKEPSKEPGDGKDLVDVQEERESEKRKEEGTSWDYEEIFAQLADQRAQKRQAHIQERREIYFAKHSPASPEEQERLEQQWGHLEKAMATIEELTASGAPMYGWVNFLHSSAFFAVKGDKDFVAALESFLRCNPSLDEQVRGELSKAFGLRHGTVPPIWQGLNELLNGVTYKTSERGNDRKSRRRVALAAVLGFVVLIPVIFLMVSLVVEYVSGLYGKGERDRLCQYMEEDFGRAIESRWEGRANYENLYAPWDEPELTFMAWPAGERNLAEGERGYTTNYSDVMVAKELDEFAKKWSFELELRQEGGCDGVMGVYGSSPGTYILKLPLWGAEEGLAALGELMEQLEAKAWYQAFPPSYQLCFAYRDLSYLIYTSQGPFDGVQVLDYYKNEMGGDLCAFLVDKSGLACEDFNGNGFRLESFGTVELAGKCWFLVSGLDRTTGEILRQYIYNGSSLTSIPAEQFNPDLKSYELSGERFDSTWKEVPQYLWITRR